MNMIAANLVQLIGTALIPIIVFLITSELHKALIWIGSLTIMLSILGFIYRTGRLLDAKKLFPKALILLKYGYARLPSFLAQFLLIAGIPLILVEEISFTDMAFLNSGISLVRLSLIVVTPIGMILLPRISSALSRNKTASLTSGLSTLILVTHAGSWVVSISIYLHTEFLIKLWLGEVTLAGIWIVKVIILALPFYAIMGVLRSPIDAGSEKAYNSIIYFVSAIFMIFLYYLLKTLDINSITSGTVAFIGGHFSTTVLSLYFSSRLFRIKIKYLAMVSYTIIIVVGSIALFRMLTYLMITEYLRIILYTLLIVISCLVFYFRSNQEWVVNLRSRLSRNGKS
jgi:O-antigen/teichoic acid export membrane protein